VWGGLRGMLPRGVAFWLVGSVFFLLAFAAGAPSPLCGVYQLEWRFSAGTLTAVLLVMLLFSGSPSDYLSLRRVIVVGLAVNAAPPGRCFSPRTARGCFSRAGHCRPVPAAWRRGGAGGGPRPSLAEVHDAPRGGQP
jgi:hypothetical protein